ncbi:MULTISPECIES: cbb3-type cytochrome oxidase assembly protein CcoS [Chryseobacterium group]|jgi:cbb3-type cytochrome oxidase maturation protein|uniref:cbb3-type cytochrome oxidase assembly protein CcoS n=1 Tax=Chryseobacterium group TaxID=2782232 RepID=UPI001A25D03E|nr:MULTISPECIES: cbb3-type cytochrome oxidase assembly protein CcoS [Chryseobacterium]MBH1958604.1 cbb3-type cytochrome oxidase assembly protein CcoS [Flavobacteriia bacterium]MBH2024153.1 cbb3-type cytochrome oxidase assembly protein CcoS [Flavobacteriales bacterium]MCP2037448.1 cbb3-type cytochrome oxidase maturation protein [Chryseobacterium sp. HSC-36S06]UFK96875.1 cbb3-type cytochrome oxidase assembly protein CcoS [Chryseobacterium faecale]
MDILYLMILCSVSLAVVFLIVFIINVKKGQFEDDESPAVRILLDSEIIKEEPESDQEKPELKNKTEAKSD